MSPKGRSNGALRGPGRPKRAAAQEDAPVAVPAPAKRGRAAAKADADSIEVAVEPPKKRGRPAKAKAEEPVPVVEDPPAPKKRGRPSLKAAKPVEEEVEAAPKRREGPPKEAAAAVEEEALAPKKRRGRPRKEDAAPAEAPATPKRGRPARTAVLDLHRVAGSPRIGKRTSPRTKATKPVAAPPRLDSRMRSKLRTRLAPAKKIAKDEPAPKLKDAKRGRPRKAAVEALAPKKAAGRKATEVATEKPTKPAKPLAPRKIRGHTVRQIPDKFVAQVDQFLHERIQADKALEEQAAEMEVEALAEEADHLANAVADGVMPDGALVSSEQDRDQYQDHDEFSEGALEMDAQHDGTHDEDQDDEMEPNVEEYEDVDVEMSVHENVHLKQDADGGDIIVEEVDTEIAVHEHGAEVLGPFDDEMDEEDFARDEEDYAHQDPRPSAAAIVC
jgi:hypothetical protein